MSRAPRKLTALRRLSPAAAVHACAFGMLIMAGTLDLWTPVALRSGRVAGGAE